MPPRPRQPRPLQPKGVKFTEGKRNEDSLERHRVHHHHCSAEIDHELRPLTRRQFDFAGVGQKDSSTTVRIPEKEKKHIKEKQPQPQPKSKPKGKDKAKAKAESPLVLAVPFHKIDITNQLLCGACGSAGDLRAFLICTDCAECYHPYCFYRGEVPPALSPYWRCAKCRTAKGDVAPCDAPRCVLGAARVLCYDKDTRACALCRLPSDLPDGEGGRLLPVDVDVWVHCDCCAWSAEVEDTPGKKERRGAAVLTGVRDAIITAQRKFCAQCGKCGASLTCSEPECTRYYHFLCARRCGCTFVAKRRSREHLCYCPDHQPLAQKKADEAVTPATGVTAEQQTAAVTAAANSQAVLLRKFNQRMLVIAEAFSSGVKIDDKLLQIHTPCRVGSVTVLSFTENDYKSVKLFWALPRSAGAAPLNEKKTLADERVLAAYHCEVRPQQAANGSLQFSVTHELPHAEMPPMPTTTTCDPLAVWHHVVEALNATYGQLPIPTQQHPVPLPADVKTEPPAADNADTRPHDQEKEQPQPPQSQPQQRPLFCVTTAGFYYGHDLPWVVTAREIEARGLPPCTCARTIAYNDWKAAHGDATTKTVHYGLSAATSFQQLSYIQKQADLPFARQFKKLHQMTQYLYVGRSGIQGLGVFARVPFVPQTVLLEYVGQLIRHKVADIREERFRARGIGDYMFSLGDGNVVDATEQGNITRFINHSCDPNAYSQIINVNGGQKKIVIITKRDIAPGEEITYNYLFPLEEGRAQCRCGAACCNGFIN
eukprot:TRINITY_DN458_c0_g1_i3.p1 TRINITY_DN458_c0_g1~~TRINITY_DN458_c0_g1_i3.p1  ORF type:complete len:767 (-),score=158.80 TRINITY_DN458_c0_g1_i3:38-2338(-)